MAYIIKKSSEEKGHELSGLTERLPTTFSIRVSIFSKIVDKVC